MNLHGELTISATEKHLEKRLRSLFAPLKKLYLPTITLIELALYEAVKNGLEHGCLAIGFQLKRVLLEYNYYEKEVARRRENRSFSQKNVTVSYLYSDDALQFCVKDDGDGFDWKKFMQDYENELAPAVNVSGSGLKIISTVFDSLSFNEQGNELTMTKYLSFSEEQ